MNRKNYVVIVMKVIHRVMVCALILVISGVGMLMQSCGKHTAVVHAQACPDVEVIFARGTSEPAGLGKVGTAFVNALRTRVPGSVDGYGVHYPANYIFTKATDGANDASDHIDYMIASCPQTHLVLGGYSQGAAVIDILAAVPVAGFGFTSPLSEQAPEHIAAIALFGNPSAKLGQPLTRNPTYGKRTIDLCTVGDPICSDGNDPVAHVAYVPGMTNRAAQFVAQFL